MREIGKAMERAGATWISPLLRGSGSLDGLVIPSIRCGICDGTSPHVMEPVYPAAVERYVDLGRFYDLPAARRRRQEVKRHTRDYRDAYARAYRCLKAAPAGGTGHGGGGGAEFRQPPCRAGAFPAS